MATKQKTKEEEAKEAKEAEITQDDNKDEGKDQLVALDACLTSSTLSVGIGLLGGFLGSMIVRKRWPLVVGLGFGVGQSIGCCREEFEEDKGDDDKKGGKGEGPDDQKGGGPDDQKGGKGKGPNDTKGGKGTTPDDTKGGKGK